MTTAELEAGGAQRAPEPCRGGVDGEAVRTNWDSFAELTLEEAGSPV